MKKRRKGTKRRKIPETLIPETCMILETSETPETSDVLYVEMQDMYEESVQRSSWPVRGIAGWQVNRKKVKVVSGRNEVIYVDAILKTLNPFCSKPSCVVLDLIISKRDKI